MNPGRRRTTLLSRLTIKLPGVRIGYAVAAGAAPGSSQDACACCGAACSLVVSERFGQRRISIPYCNPCLAHVAQARTRRMAVALASLLSALALGVGLPLAWPNLPVLVLMASAVGGAAWPLVVELSWRPLLARGHTAVDHAVYPGSRGTLLCTRKAFARHLAGTRSPRLPLHATLVQLKRRSPELGFGLGAAALLVPLVSGLFTSRLRVLNLSESTLIVLVDGKPRLTMQPTSSESPVSGAELRLSAGLHQLEARTTTGASVGTVTARIVAGRSHLYAPAGERYCFWLETTTYGRAGTSVERRPLDNTQRFWLLPHDLDLWFSGAPSAGDPSRLSGGQLTALRQGPCAEPVTVIGQ